MSFRRFKKMKETTSLPSSAATVSPVAVHSLLECYNFLTPHEYSEKTLGILAFLLRKSVGTINFSHIIHAVEERNKLGSSADFIALLQEEPKSFSANDLSIENHLMLNRLIKYIQEDERGFSMIHSHIRLHMKQNLVDQHLRSAIQYPQDFRQRETDFIKLRNAQGIRRLFYFSHQEIQEPPNLISLQNRITEHLNYLFDANMNNSIRSGDILGRELERVFANSFMIIDHPRNDVNPVLIYNRKENDEYEATGSVRIISLLHDFMQTHPGLIQLYDIEPSLHPRSRFYRFNESQTLLWKTCSLQACPSAKQHIMQYAVLESIVFRQTSKKDMRKHIAKVLHTLKFSVKLLINLPEFHFSKAQEVTLESLPFAISPYTTHIPQLLTRILLSDIRRFSTAQSIGVEIIVYYMLRYFAHRTGIKPRDDQKIYLQDELNKAMSVRKNCRKLEDIFMDFLVPYVYQVEFMGKHPILAMLYADGLFLGPCNRARVAEAMKKSLDLNTSKIALRFNSIEIAYEEIPKVSVLHRIIQLNPCTVRMDLYNHRDKSIQHRTFESSKCCGDVCKFIYASYAPNLRHVQVLSTLNEATNDQMYKYFTHFAKYRHTQLSELSSYTAKYVSVSDPRYAKTPPNKDTRDSFHESDNDYFDDVVSLDGQSLTSGYATTLQDDQSVDNISINERIITIESCRTFFHGTTSTAQHTLNTENQTQFLHSQHDDTKYTLMQDVHVVPSVEDNVVQRKNQPWVEEISPSYFEGPSTLSHSVRIHKSSNNSLTVQSTPTCCKALTGLTLTTVQEYKQSQNKTRHFSTLPRNLDIVIAYLGAHPTVLKENKIVNARQLDVYNNQHECIAKLSSAKQQLTYLIISAALARIVVPLIHNYTWIENIYIHQDYDRIQSVTWMDGYPKIRHKWSSLKEIVQQIEQDIISIEMRPVYCSKTSDIFAELWAQTLVNTTRPGISSDMNETFEMPIIVTLCDIQPLPFDLAQKGLKTWQFSSVEDCHSFFEQQNISSVFLIIIIDGNTTSDKVRLMKHHAIHAAYIFCVKNNNDQEQQMILMYNDPTMSGVFNDEKDFLVQLTSDICFFWQLPMYTPKVAMLKIEFDVLSAIDEDKQAFLNFQFLVDILRQLWCTPDVPSQIFDQIKAVAANLSADLHINSVQLIREIDKLLHQFNPDCLFKASAHLHLINQQLESSVQKTYPFSTTVYRAQLLSKKDLQAMTTKEGYLLNIQTLILASRCFASTKRICRRTCDVGLTAVMLEINIPEQMPSLYLDSDTIIFPLSTVFKIMSMVKSPEGIYYVHLELANSTMDLIKNQLCCTIGHRLTWLTFGYYLTHIKNYEIAQAYLKYLQSISSDMNGTASADRTTQFTDLLIHGASQKDFGWLAEMRGSVESNRELIEPAETQSTSDTELNHYEYEKLAELYEQLGDKNSACRSYEKAFEYISNHHLPKLYQLKIESLNVKRS